MICKKCGTENPDNYIFCQNCLADLPNPELENTLLFSSAKTDYAPNENKIEQGEQSQNADANNPRNKIKDADKVLTPGSDEPTLESTADQSVPASINKNKLFDKKDLPEKKTIKILSATELLKDTPPTHAASSKVQKNVYANPDEPYLREPAYKAPEREIPKITQTEYTPAKRTKEKNKKDLHPDNPAAQDTAQSNDATSPAVSGKPGAEQRSVNPASSPIKSNPDKIDILNNKKEKNAPDTAEIKASQKNASPEQTADDDKFGTFSSSAQSKNKALGKDKNQSTAIDSADPKSQQKHDLTPTPDVSKKSDSDNTDTKIAETADVEATKNDSTASIKITDPFFNEDDDEHEYPYKTYGALKPVEARPFSTDRELSKKELRKKTRQMKKDLKAKQQLEKQMSRGRSSYDYYDYYDYYDELALKRERRRSKFINILFWLVLVTLIAVTSFFVWRLAVEKFGSASAALRSVFNLDFGKIAEGPYIMEPVTHEGVESHTLTINANKGDTLVFNNFEHTPISLDSDGANSIIIPDWVFLPLEPSSDQEYIEVTPTTTLTSADGKSTNIEIASFKLSVPKVILNFTEPQNPQNIELTQSANAAFVTISGNVIATETVSLFAGNSDISAQIKQDGTFTYDYPLEIDAESAGDEIPFSFDLIAKAPRYRSATQTISGKIIKAQDDFELVIRENFKSPTDALESVISGSVKPDSELKVKGPITDSWVFEKETGEFSFTAKLDKIGLNEFKITATNSAGTASAEKEVVIVRLPAIDVYSRTAQALEYDASLKNISAYINKTYMFVADIQDIKLEANYSIITLAVDGDEGKKIQATYYGETIPKQGSSYRIFGDLSGIAEDKTQLTMDVYFILSNVSQS